MHANERGRLTGINGVESVLTLYPERLGPRIKKSVIKMLENAHITGGWSSKSRQVAEALASKYNLSVLQTRWNGLTIYAQPTPEARDKLIEFVKADIALFLLENPNYHRSWYTQNAQDMIDNLIAGKAKYIDFRGKEYTQQAVSLINADLPKHAIEQNQHVIDILNSNTPIHLTTLRS